MKRLATLQILVIAFTLNIAAQSGNCSITCNLTTGYVCPNSATWKANPQVYNDVGLMTEIGYVKDNSGCWKLSGSKTKTITGSKSYLQKMAGKLAGIFSFKKKGF